MLLEDLGVRIGPTLQQSTPKHHGESTRYTTRSGLVDCAYSHTARDGGIVHGGFAFITRLAKVGTDEQRKYLS